LSRIRRSLQGLLIFMALTGAVAAPAGEESLPWKKGDVPVPGWVVKDAFWHGEFSRFSLMKGEVVTCVEVRYRREGDPDEWSSRFYRIQPCPYFEADEPLLRSLLDDLRGRERSPESKPFAQELPVTADTVTPPLTFYPMGFYAALNGIAVLLCLLLAVAWLRRIPEGRLCAAAGAALAAGVVIAALLAWDPARVPAGWITILHEGYGYQNVMHLYGYGVHAGDNFLVLQELWSGNQAYHSGSVVLRATLSVNVCLAIVNTIFFFVVVRLVSGKYWTALLLAFFLAANLNFINASASETPAQLVFSYILMGVPAAAHLNSGGRTGRAAAYLAMAELCLLGFLLCATRVDMIVLVLPALLAGVLQLFSLGPRILARLGDLWRWARPRWRWLLPAAVAVGLASTLWWKGYHYDGDPRIGWAIDGLFPFNPSFLTPPRFLAVFLPLGLVLLIVTGTIGAFRRPLTTLLLPLSVLVLWRVYYSATHGYGGPFYERFRFLTYLTPLFILLAAFGYRELTRWAGKISWIRSHPRVLAAVLGLTFLVWWPPGWGGYFDSGHELENLPRKCMLLSRNQQTEVRYLLDLMDRHPECIFLTRTIKYENPDEPRYIWGLFGRKVRTELFYQAEGDTLDGVAAAHAGRDACVLFYYGLDCNKRSGDRCREQIEGRPLVEEHLLDNLQYTDFHGEDSHPDQIRLGVFRVKGAAAGL